VRPVAPLSFRDETKEGDGSMQREGQTSLSKGPAPPRGDKRTVIFMGHARLPRSLAGRDASPVVSVEAEADMATDTMVGATAKGVPSLAGKLVEEVLASRSLEDGPQEAVDRARQRYVCPSHKALCTAVANAYDAYHRHRDQGSRSP
jgi:hypothetical protein